MKLHLDLDAFFVSAHRTKDKSLCNKPVVVVKRHDEEIFKNSAEIIDINRGAFVGRVVSRSHEIDKGIVVTASYEAREYGIHVGMNLYEAKLLKPDLIVIPTDYKLYSTLSYRLKNFLKRHIPHIEQFSIDEFFGDVTGWIDDDKVEDFAYYLKNEIYKKFSLPISIGVADSKWIAKVATSFAKPNGVYVVRDLKSFLKKIPIEKFPGIGDRLYKRLAYKGIMTLYDIKDKKKLFYSWGKNGIKLYKRILGIDNEEVKEKEGIKSLGISRKFSPIYNKEEAIRRIFILSRHLAYIIKEHKVNPTFYSLKIVYKNSTVKEKKRVYRLFSEQLLKDIMYSLFIKASRDDWIIGIGIRVGEFKKVSNLFDYEEDLKLSKIDEAIYNIRKKYGIKAILNGVELG